jgi:16S rRNA (guanine966-N2)-methyltransferase
MRVIAGSQRGRRLLAAQGLDLRPTSGRVKEALFSILGARIEGARFLDLYAGTGAIGIEAASRGAAQVAFVESNSASLRVLQSNLRHCGMSDDVDVHACAAEAFVGRATPPAFDIVFADPPYRIDSIRGLLPSLARSAIIGPQTIVILEHPTKQRMPAHIDSLTRFRSYRYGDTSLTAFQLTPQDPSAP